MRLLPRLPRLTPDLVAYIALTLLILWGLADTVAPYRGIADTGCRVSYVYDGDTVEMMCDGRAITARIVGLNAPETRDAACPSEAELGTRATAALRAALRGGEVKIYPQGHDKYGRDLVVITVDGMDVADTLIAQGMAEPYGGGARRDWCD